MAWFNVQTNRNPVLGSFNAGDQFLIRADDVIAAIEIAVEEDGVTVDNIVRVAPEEQSFIDIGGERLFYVHVKGPVQNNSCAPGYAPVGLHMNGQAVLADTAYDAIKALGKDAGEIEAVFFAQHVFIVR